MTDERPPLASFPTLVVSELAHSTYWYRSALGFELVLEMHDDEGHDLFAHLRWAGHADLLLVGDDPDRPIALPRGLGVTLSFTLFDGSIDELAARAKSHGAEIVVAPVDRPWNAREVLILDPDGYRLLFTQRIDPRKELGELVAKVVLGSEATVVKPRRRRVKVGAG